MNFELKRQICSDAFNMVIKHESPFPYIIPNQHFPTININSNGFRGNEIETNPDYRIFVIGGSTTFGSATSSDDTTMPSYLKEFLTKNFNEYKIEVVNAGIPAAYSLPEKNMILNKVLDFKPNMLIIYDGWNDATRNYGLYHKIDSNSILDTVVKEIKEGEYITLKVLVKFLSNVEYNPSKVLKVNTENFQNKTNLWKNSWQEICLLENQYNFKTVIVLQPLLGTGNKTLSIEEQKNLIHFDSVNLSEHYQLFADELKNLDSTCSLTLDLRHVFDSYSETIYFDAGHTSEFGNKIIANEIYKEILPTLKNDLEY